MDALCRGGWMDASCRVVGWMRKERVFEWMR